MAELLHVEFDMERYVETSKGYMRRHVIGNLFFHADRILLRNFHPYHHELLDHLTLEIVETELKEKALAMNYFTFLE